jgi:hypothetical protein
MSEKIVHRAPDGTEMGTEIYVSPTWPSKNSSRKQRSPTPTDGPLRLSVRCRAWQLIGVYGDDPVTLLGAFGGADTLRLRGAVVIAPRPDLFLAWVRAGRDPADFAELIVADTSNPLQIGCPVHADGHYVDTALLRGEVDTAVGAVKGAPLRCAVGRVAYLSSVHGLSST